MEPTQVEVYELQHEIWPRWALDDGGAVADAAMIDRCVAGAVPGRMLDMGCGSGKLACAMAGRGWTVTGIDLSETLVARAQERAQRLGVSGATKFTRADISTWMFPDRFDLVVFWDSVLSLWSLADVRAILDRVARSCLASGGILAVGQLNPAYYARLGTLEVVIEDPAVGPGRTDRRYHFDAASNTLRDEVTHISELNGVVRLPSQILQLADATVMSQALTDAGLVSVAELGSLDWQWPEGPNPVTEKAAQFVVTGRAP